MTSDLRERPPAEIVIDLSTYYFVSRSVHVVAELGVADALSEAPMSAGDLAKKIGAHGPALYRVLRLLASYGVFAETGDKFVHTEASHLLRSDHPRSLRPWARMMGASINWQAYERLEHSVRTGRSARDLLIQGDFFADYLPKHPELGTLFDQSMTAAASQRIPAIVEAFDCSRFKLIGDIGGGRGHLIDTILAATPSATGVLFDLPHVVARAPRLAGERLAIMGGNFFKDPLPACDGYLLMHVIHDWSDEESVEILKAVRKAAPKGARVLVIERIIPEGPGPDIGKRMDIHMLAALSGKERTEREFRRLFAASGLALETITPTKAASSILESAAIA